MNQGTFMIALPKVKLLCVNKFIDTFFLSSNMRNYKSNSRIRRSKGERRRTVKQEVISKSNNLVESTYSNPSSIDDVNPSQEQTEHTSKVDPTKIMVYGLQGALFAAMIIVGVLYKWYALLFIPVIWFLQNLINDYEEEKCTNCGMWDGTYIDSTDFLDEWSNWETRVFVDVTESAKDRQVISRTYRNQQVLVTYRKYLYHCKCSGCDYYYNYESTSSFVN
jgi:hypothetical protein